MKKVKILLICSLFVVLCLPAISCKKPTDQAKPENSEHTHQHTLEVITEPSCTEAGLGRYTCNCGDTYDAAIDSTGHTYTQHVTPATCTEDGYAQYSCAECGHSYEETLTHTGHQYEAVDTIPASCTEDGHIRRTCKVCQDTYDEILAHQGHNYTQGKVPATCTLSGYIRYTCTNCQDTYDETLSPLGHSYTSNIVPATCTSNGYAKYTCSVCQYNYETTLVSSGHKYAYSSSVPATCTEDGYYRYICSACQDVKDDPVQRTGHNYKKTTVSATCTTNGYYKYTCSKCQDSYTESSGSAAVGHTCGITGVCSRCNADVSVYMPSRLSAPTLFKFSHWEAAYMRYKCSITNNSGKTIKYCTIRFVAYNAVGDVFDEIDIKVTGPISNGETITINSKDMGIIVGSYSNWGEARSIKELEIKYVKLEYSDGSVEAGYYGYSTTETY